MPLTDLHNQTGLIKHEVEMMPLLLLVYGLGLGVEGLGLRVKGLGQFV